MSLLLHLILVPLVVASSMSAPSPVATQASQPTQYYVSLGTSLAAGIQVDKKTGEQILTDDAYSDKIYQRVRGQIPNLEHKKLGCSGETSQTMIDGGNPYCPQVPSQLTAAEAFLKAHEGEIAFITLDIGANDMLACLDAPDLGACGQGVGATLVQNLNVIVPTLQAAAPGVPIIAINYYNPVLAVWPENPDFAIATTQLVMSLNGLFESYYPGAFGVPVADVAGEFATDDFTMKGNLPNNVKTICQLTYNCDYNNIHPNDNGYKVIARTVEQLMKDLGLL